tara:strand:+ start:496 stop:1026 length:531 start_codon:yes stop_codon:yes gene_type:complete
MGKYYLYNGKQVGFVRKAIDEVVMVEEGWVSEVQNHFGKRTHDKLLQIPAQILKNSGFPDITRAQAWIILLEILNKGVPEALRDADVDEKIGKGTILKDIVKAPARAAAEVVDTTSKVTGKVVGGAVGAASSAAGAVAGAVGKGAEVAGDVAEGVADTVEDAVDAVTGEEDGEGAQ